MGNSIHFPASDEPDKKRKVLRLRIENENKDLKQSILNLSSLDLRRLIGVNNYDELKKEAKANRRSLNSHALSLIDSKLSITQASQQKLFDERIGTYRGGNGDFFHDLFPYLEAFSPNFVDEIVNRYAPNSLILLDPFGGCGTAPLTFSKKSIKHKAYYCEVNPLMQRITWIKEEIRSLPFKTRNQLSSDIQHLRDKLSDLVDETEQYSFLAVTYKQVFSDSDIFPENTLLQAQKLKTLIRKTYVKSPFLSYLLEISVLSSLVPASNMQRAGDLRRKRIKEREKNSANLLDHIESKLLKIETGLKKFNTIENKSTYLSSNAKNLSKVPSINADIIITSPPYLNGTNYFRNTKIELWFMGVLNHATDIGIFRDKALTAGINDVRGIRSRRKPDFKEPNSLIDCLIKLDQSAYDRRIPSMVRWYAYDLSEAISNSLFHLKNNGIIVIDIGDSIYSGVKVPTDSLVEELLEQQDCEIVDSLLIRERLSQSGHKVHQKCVVAKKTNGSHKRKYILKNKYKSRWLNFKKYLPHQQKQFKKRNWGHPNHSLCSFQGKIKPSIAHYLVNSFVPENGTVLDPFSGVGTIPFEASLSGRLSFGLDLSPAAIAISRAKTSIHDHNAIKNRLNELHEYVDNTKHDVTEKWLPNFNKSLKEYYHQETLKEILAARKWFQNKHPWDKTTSLILSSVLHILHGNRPYALSRRSHPITPYSPSGEYEYKSLIVKLREKINRVLNAELPQQFKESVIYEIDSTKYWPVEIDNLDAIITSPPFFDSTRFFLSNWIRLWFSGWESFDFETGKKEFVEEKQKVSFNCYDLIFQQGRERLKSDGVMLLHLGKSNKCDMGVQLEKHSKQWFNKSELFIESVSHCETHGFKDKGAVTDHQYLLLY